MQQRAVHPLSSTPTAHLQELTAAISPGSRSQIRSSLQLMSLLATLQGTLRLQLRPLQQTQQHRRSTMQACRRCLPLQTRRTLLRALLGLSRQLTRLEFTEEGSGDSGASL